MTQPADLTPVETGKWIVFYDGGRSPSGVTRLWFVYTKGGGQLGLIKWFSRWRCYSFFPLAETVYESRCLRDISEFCALKTTMHRRGKP